MFAHGNSCRCRTNIDPIRRRNNPVDTRHTFAYNSSMDFTFTDALETGGVSATLILIVGIGVKLFQKFCGNRVRSECCGKEGTVGVVVEPMSPRASRPSLETVRVVPGTPPMPTRTADLDKTSTAASRTQSPSSAAAPSTDVPQPPPLAI